MKNNLFVLFALIIGLSAVVFGQKPEPTPDPTTITAKPQSKPDAPAEKPAPSVEKPAAAPEKMPTPAEIIARYVKEIGGRDAILTAKSRMMTGTVEIAPMGIKGTMVMYMSAPDKMFSKITLGGIGDLLEGFDGTTSWTINPLQGNREKTGDELIQTKLTADFYRDANLEKLFPKMELKGIEKVDGKDAYVIVGTPEKVSPQTFYFDKETGLLVRQDTTVFSPEGSQPTKTFLSDYKAVDGVKIPHSSRTILPQFEMIIKLTDVKNDVEIKETVYAKPKQ